jgi:cell wall-associated NlpC family hydrolase
MILAGRLTGLRLVPIVAVAFAAGCATAASTNARPEAFPRSGGWRPPVVEMPVAAPVAAGASSVAATPASPGFGSGAAAPPNPVFAGTPVAPVIALIDTARLQQGVRYQLGGATPADGFDCSGLVRYVFRQHGVELPRTVAEQFDHGTNVGRDRLAPGDLIFFSTTGPGATHVGIVIDQSTFLHAPDTGATVRVERFDTPYWAARYLGARRVAG